MRLPRDMDAPELINALCRIGYSVVRQTGSHIRLRSETPQPYSLTVPNHSPLKLGTLAAIILDVASHQGMTRDEVVAMLLTH